MGQFTANSNLYCIETENLLKLSLKPQVLICLCPSLAPGTVIQSQVISRMCKEGAACRSRSEQQITVTANSRNHSKVERLATELMKVSGSAVHKEGAPSWRFRSPINTLGNMCHQ
jgi:hypothetical protein